MAEYRSVEHLFDKRVSCHSIMVAMPVAEYITLVKPAYDNRGGIAHQRDALKTSTGKRIRERMIRDIIAGAVLPPVVIGVVVDQVIMDLLPGSESKAAVGFVTDMYADKISIIDGMQRTTALIEALEKDPAVGALMTRVEFWFAIETNSLIYRMLVLNTGQVPWNLSRQLQVVYAPLVDEMKKAVKFERVLNPNDKQRRTKAGEYSPDNLVELYIAFGVRKTDIDTQESLADEFSRLDMTEAVSDKKNSRIFYETLQIMVDLDKAFARLDVDEQNDDDQQTGAKLLKSGRNIFDSKPARVGFVVAVATKVLGRIGMGQDTDDEKVNARLETIKRQSYDLIEKLNSMTPEQLSEFLKLDVLSERLYGQKRSAVGRYERQFFDTAFRILIEENFAVPTMDPCWRNQL